MKTIAFASDFDNTIYFGKEANPFHKEDIAAIQEFQKKGGLFGICSGRALRGIDYPSKGILNYDFKISATGSRIVGKDNALLYEDPIETALAKEIYFFLKQNTNFWVVLNTGKYLFSEHEILDGLPPNKEEDLFVSPICGVSVDCLNETDAFQWKKLLEGKYPDIIAYQNKNFLDRVKKGNSKGHGIQEIRKILKADIVSGRGDSYNDIPLLEEADPSYTFYSSPELVQNEATKVVSSISDALNDLRTRFF